MGFISKALKGIGRMYTSAFSNMAGMIGIETSHARKKRHKEQDRLTRQQIEGEKELFDYTLAGQEQAKENWAQKYETPLAKKNLLINAGLNPALMYGTAGEGGVSNAGLGGQTGSVGRGEDTAMEYMNVKAQKFNMAMQALLTKNQIKVGNSEANRNNAAAEKDIAQTLTENKSRDYIVEGIKQNGIEKWLQNNEKEFLQHYGVITDLEEQEMNATNYVNYVFEKNQRIEYNSLWTQNAVQGVLNIIADNEVKYSEEEVNRANAILADERAQGVMYDLLTGRINAITASKQMSYNTGETWNAKQVMELSTLMIGTVLGGITKVGTMKNVAKSLNQKVKN